jgi:hypothetical protein
MFRPLKFIFRLDIYINIYQNTAIKFVAISLAWLTITLNAIALIYNILCMQLYTLDNKQFQYTYIQAIKATVVTKYMRRKIYSGHS